MNRRILAAAVLGTVTGCSDFTPETGTYGLDEFTQVDVGCGLEHPDEDDDPTFELGLAADGVSATVEFEDGFDFPCTMTGKRLQCEPVVFDHEKEGTTFTQTLEFGGVFDDEVSLTGEYSIAMACDGPACAEMETELDTTFPCSAGFDFSSTLRTEE